MGDSTERQQAHELIERLRPEQVSALISLLQFMLLDPVSRALASAPVDDEPETERERRAVAEADDWFDKNRRGIPFEEVLGDLGLTRDEIRRQQELK